MSESDKRWGAIAYLNQQLEDGRYPFVGVYEVEMATSFTNPMAYLAELSAPRYGAFHAPLPNGKDDLETGMELFSSDNGFRFVVFAKDMSTQSLAEEVLGRSSA